MAHRHLTLDEFAERLNVGRNRPDWPHRIQHITEYCQALLEGSHEYFFMRGVEGYLASRNRSPIYKQEEWAQDAWKSGYRFAKTYLNQVNRHSFHHYNRCWLDAYVASDFELVFDADMYTQNNENWYCAVFGLYARLHAHCIYTCRGFQEYFLDADKPLQPRAHNAHKFTRTCQSKKGIKQMAQDLFKDVATGVIGTWVGEDDDGNTVLQTDKGFQAFKEVKKVMPYTIRVRYDGGGLAHVRAKKDEYRVGDILLIYHAKKGPGMVSIRELDTEKEEAYEMPTVIKFLHKVKRK